MNLNSIRKYSIVRVLSCFDVDPIQVLLPLACSYKVNFDTEGSGGLFLLNFDDRVVSQVPINEGAN